MPKIHEKQMQSMKILHLIPSLKKGGAERLVTDLVRELKTRPEIQVRLVIFRNEIEYNVEDLRDVLHIIPSSVQLSIWKKNKLDVMQLQAIINDIQPDIIHSHLFEAEIVSRSCFYPKAKWFSHGHDNMKQLSIKNKSLKERLTQLFEKHFLTKRYEINHGNKFIVISKHSETYFKKNIQKSPIYRLPNAINFNKFVNFKIKREESHRIQLISVGSLTTLKNHKFLIDVADHLKQKNVHFQMTILGDGPIRNELEELVKLKQLNGKVFFIGNQEKVEDFLWQSTIYLHSSMSEALGLALLEAMAAGLPVITLDGGGNRDLIEEGKNGYMIFEENPQLFADKISELWENQEKYKAMSQYAKQYDIKPYVDKLLALYQSA